MTELKFNFIKTGNFAGTGELYVNGKKVGETDLPCRTTIMSQLPGLGPAGRHQTHLSAPQGGPAHLNSPAPFFRCFPPQFRWIHRKTVKSATFFRVFSATVSATLFQAFR